MVQVESWLTTIHTPYVPFGTFEPDTVMSLFTSNSVAQLAPGVQTSPYCTAFVPKIGQRPRIRGRE